MRTKKAEKPKSLPLPVRISQNKAVLNLHRDWIKKNIKELGSMREWISRVRSLLRNERNNGQYASAITNEFNSKIESLQKQIDKRVTRSELKSKASDEELQRLKKFVATGRHPGLAAKGLQGWRCTSCDRPVVSMHPEPSKERVKNWIMPISTKSIAPGGGTFGGGSRAIVENMLFQHQSTESKTPSAAPSLSATICNSHQTPVTLPTVNKGETPPPSEAAKREQGGGRTSRNCRAPTL